MDFFDGSVKIELVRGEIGIEVIGQIKWNGLDEGS